MTARPMPTRKKVAKKIIQSVFRTRCQSSPSIPALLEIAGTRIENIHQGRHGDASDRFVDGRKCDFKMPFRKKRKILGSKFAQRNQTIAAKKGNLPDELLDRQRGAVF